MPIFLNNIHIDIPYKHIYARLGYRKSSTVIEEAQEKKILDVINSYYSYIKLQASYVRLDIVEKQENLTVFKEFAVESVDFAKFLKDSSEVFLMGTTAGKDIVELRNSLMKDDNFKAVIVDAMGAETVESFTKWVNDYLEKLVIREGRTVTTRRYSPGYGDFALKYQSKIAEILQLEKISVKLSDSFILDPEKSVTAFLGII